MTKPQLTLSAIEPLLQDARARATEAGLHRLTDDFLEKVQPCLAAMAADAFGEDGPAPGVLASRLANLEAANCRHMESLARMNIPFPQGAARPADFRWRGELSILAAFTVAGLVLDITGTARLDLREWLALGLSGTLVAINFRAAAAGIRGFFTGAGRIFRRLSMSASARRMAKDIRRLRLDVAGDEDNSSRCQMWVARHVPVILAEYKLYRTRAAAAAEWEA